MRRTFAEDGVLYSPYASATKGRAAIEMLHRDWTGDGGNAKTLTVLEAGSSDDLGWCIAAYSEGGVTGDGNWRSVFARQPDGRWLIRFCTLTADTPPLA